jgi:hypothetical protein
MLGKGQGAPGESHGEGLDRDGREVEDARVQIDGAQRPAGDDHALKLLEHWPYRQPRIQAAQLRSNPAPLTPPSTIFHPSFSFLFPHTTHLPLVFPICPPNPYTSGLASVRACLGPKSRLKQRQLQDSSPRNPAVRRLRLYSPEP